MHTLGLSVTKSDGNSLGFRNGLFMRIPTDLQQSTFMAHYYLDDQYQGELPISGHDSVMHLDIDSSALESGIHSVTVYIASPYGMATQAKTAWFVKIPEGGEGVKKFSYWLNDDEKTLKTVELDEVCNPYKILSLIEVRNYP